MNPVWNAIFIGLVFVSLLLPIHSYVFYPWLLQRFRKQYPLQSSTVDLTKKVYVLIAAYNEENVIAEKLRSIVESDYSLTNLEVWIGSDASTDHTDAIVLDFARKFEFVHLVRMEGRLGKPAIINRLVELCKVNPNDDAILILTDANVFFQKDMLQTLVNGFQNDNIGLIGANVVNKVPENSSIGELEGIYINRENKIKKLESDWAGVLMGPFGACFAMRARDFVPIPSHFLVDDFYWCMQVLKRNCLACFNAEALCYEDLPGDWKEEFRRKRRIARGNFQNLKHFSSLLRNPFSKRGFAFLSHKVLRWLSPLFFLFSIGLLLMLNFIMATVLIAVIVGGVLIAELIARVLRIKSSPFNAILYFCLMNLAVFIGMIEYLFAKQKNAGWKPTLRKV